MLEQLINNWIEKHSSILDNELDAFANCESAEKNIRLAAKGRTVNDVKLSHQKRLKLDALDVFATQLVADNQTWPQFVAFTELFAHVQVIANGINGIGDLAVYDTALRIGRRLGLAPIEVYLQRGSREGAKQLIKRIPRGRRSVSPSIFPQELQTLKPYQIENFLCVCKKDF